MVQYYRDMWLKRSEMLAPLSGRERPLPISLFDVCAAANTIMLAALAVYFWLWYIPIVGSQHHPAGISRRMSGNAKGTPHYFLALILRRDEYLHLQSKLEY